MKALLHKILYRTLPLEGYLRAVSRLFFISYRLGLGRRSAATEYVYHLPRLAKAGDTAIDIGANLGYYARPLSEIVGTAGRVHAVEPVPVVCRVLRRNLRGCRNVEIFDCALGAENKEITMSNDSARETGYLGTGRNFVGDAAGEGAGVGPRLLRQPDQGRPAPRLPPAGPGEQVGDGLLHRPPGQQAVLLKQEGGAWGNRHHPGRPPLEARQHPQQGGLAAAGGAGQGGDPRLRQHQGEVVQHPLFPITDRNMFR